MKDEKKEIVGLWFKKADEDELSSLSLLEHRDGMPGTVCFLSQQMAEKYLKGFLVFLKNDIVKIHDLIRLGEILSDAAPDIKNMHKYMEFLNRFYVDTRYPGDFPEFSWSEAEEAYKAAKKIKEFVLSKVGE